MEKQRVYFVIDMKSFFASVECAERGLDPLTTKLVVADEGRTDSTICLAVSPALKKLGYPNRCRLFEIPKTIDFIIAPPRMKKYIEYAAEIYGIYLKYIEILVFSAKYRIFSFRTDRRCKKTPHKPSETWLVR